MTTTELLLTASPLEVALTLVISLIITWGIGLLPPILLRYKILKRPIKKKAYVIAIVVVLLFVNLILFSIMGSQSSSHGALFLVAIASYWILRRGLQK